MYGSELLLGGLLLVDNFLQFVDGAHLACTSFSYRHAIARLQVLGLFWCPRDLSYMFVCTWKISCHLYTLYWENTLISSHFRPAHKVDSISIIKMADLEQTLLHFSSSNIR